MDLLIRIFDRNMHMIFHYYLKHAYFKGAEADARRTCDLLGGYTWDVQRA